MAGLRFVFPLPPDDLKVNRRMGQHWGTQHRLKADYRTMCQISAQRQTAEYMETLPIAPNLATCHMTARAYLGARQRCDPPDLGSWCKVPIDALVTVGILVSDSAVCIRSFTAIVERDPRNPRLEITLKEA